MFGNQLEPAILEGGDRALLSFGGSLQSDNARPHIPRHTMKHNQDLQLEVLTPSAMFIGFVVCFLLGISPASEFYMPTFR